MPETEDSPIVVEEEEWNKVLKRLRPWKSLGPDQIQGFYWKSLGSLRQGSRFTTERFLNGLDVPAILVSGRTTLIPKGTEELEKPSKYQLPVLTYSTSC